jgi:hypothetical protein
MKITLRLCLSAAALLATGPAFAQNATPTPPSATTAPAAAAQDFVILEEGGRKYLQVSTINTIHGNYEFRKNVQVVLQRQQGIQQLNARRNIALTTPEKEALTRKIDEESEQLKKDDQQMRNAYGYTLLQQYVYQVIDSRVYLALTEDEYSKISESDKKKPDYIISRPSKDKDGKDTEIRLKQIAVITGVEKNNILRNDAEQIKALNQQIRRLEEIKGQVSNADDKKKVEEELKKYEDAFLKKSDETLKTYGFNLSGDWSAEPEKAELRLPVTDEQIQKLKELKTQNAANPAPATTTTTTPPTTR